MFEIPMGIFSPYHYICLKKNYIIKCYWSSKQCGLWAFCISMPPWLKIDISANHVSFHPSHSKLFVCFDIHVWISCGISWLVMEYLGDPMWHKYMCQMRFFNECTLKSTSFCFMVLTECTFWCCLPQWYIYLVKGLIIGLAVL